MWQHSKKPEGALVTFTEREQRLLDVLKEKEKLSLSQMSDKLMLMGIDIPKSSLQNIEKGKRVVKEYEFYALCKFFNVTMEEMLKDFIKELK